MSGVAAATWAERFGAQWPETSMACAERALPPAVREAAPETPVIAGGFSCRTQIEHGADGRTAPHLAEVLRLACRGDA